MGALTTRPDPVRTPKRWYWTARALRGAQLSRTAWEYVNREATETACQVWLELTTTRWWIAFAWLLFLCWLASLATALYFFVSLTSYAGGWITSACSPDGTFRLNPTGQDAWAMEGFFQVTVAFGNFDFTQAKVIDIAWEVVVGRGGQMVLAWFSWKVFSTYVATSMQVQPVTLETFRTVFFGEDPNLLGIGRLIRDFWARRRLVSRVATAFMLFSMAFVAVFPTIASAPTGYTTANKAFVPDANKALIPYSDFSTVIYIIHDGSRINLTDEYPVIRSRYPWEASSDVISLGSDPYLLSSFPDTCDGWLNHNSVPFQEDFSMCFMRGNLSKYLSEYGFYGRSNRSTIYNGVSLPAPALNISATYLPHYNKDFGWNWTDPTTNTMPFASASDTTVLMAASNKTYTFRYVKESGVCAPQDSYTWGFSAIQLAILIGLLFCWSLGLCVLWLKAQLTIELRGGLEVPGPYKSSLIFASALRREAMGEEKDVDTYTDAELHNLLDKHRRGGAVSLEPLAPRATFSFFGLAMREMWWLLAWTAATLCSGLTMTELVQTRSWMFESILSSPVRFFAHWSLCASLSIIIAMFLGRTLRTRVLYVVLGLFTGLVIILIV